MKREAKPWKFLLLLPADGLKQLAESLDGILLTGSASDIDTSRYGAQRHSKTAEPDHEREHTDDNLLNMRFAAHMPVLAICYGAQILNVHQNGTLVQDVPSELGTPIDHDRSGDGDSERHSVQIDGGRLAELTNGAAVRVNSSHHQSILQPGRDLRVTARATDGVVEAVLWTGGPEWIVGVKWHT